MTTSGPEEAHYKLQEQPQSEIGDTPAPACRIGGSRTRAGVNGRADGRKRQYVGPIDEGDGRSGNFILVGELSVRAVVEQTHAVRKWTVEQMRALGLSRDCVDGVELAVGEAYINAVVHGCHAPLKAEDAVLSSPSRKGAIEGCSPVRDPQVVVRVLASGDAVALEVIDPGTGFDPHGVHSPDIQQMDPTGRGIYFIHMAMDEVKYEFGSRTLVRMIKYMKSTEGIRGGA